MSVFRRVDARTAGSGAVGILVPPGPRSLVIVRPKALGWDLLPAQWQGDQQAAPAFCGFSRDEAAALARAFQGALEDAVRLGQNPVETFGAEDAGAFQVWVRAAGYFWIACRRAAGRPYAPLLFRTRTEAEDAGRQLARFLHPAPDAEQEYYFNTQNFAT
jgi:hypothetical protein